MQSSRSRRHSTRLQPGARPISVERLSSGVKVVAEPMAGIRSVALGIWLRRGSRHEPDELSGVSHFIEHTLFKGTSRRSQPEIAREIDAMGGGLDAFTTKEMACYHARAVDDQLPRLVDLLTDLVRNPAFAARDVAQERKVILEEIKMARDTPDDLAHELFTERLWTGHPLGRPILGTPRTVRAIGSRQLRDFWERAYGPRNLLVTAAGRFDTARLLGLLDAAFAGHRLGSLSSSQDPPRPREPVRVKRHREELEQVHLCLGVPAPPRGHRSRHAMQVLNVILGGGMSSRLFQRVREERGLAYTVYSFVDAYRDAGYLMVYAGCSPQNVREVVRLVRSELEELATQPVEAEELERARGHLKGGLMLGLESTGGRMTNLAQQELYFGRQSSLDEMLADIDGVTGRQIGNLAGRLLRGRRLNLSMVGNLHGVRLRSGDLDLG